MRSRLLKSLCTTALAASAVMLTATCATSGTEPRERLVASQAAVRAAEEVGAQQDPRGALHLKLAREQLADAKEAMAKKDYVKADLLLERAAADAEVAIALAKQNVAQAEAARIQREVASLQQTSPSRRR